MGIASPAPAEPQKSDRRACGGIGSRRQRESRWRRLLLALLLAAALLVTWGALSAPLAEPDEARYAEIAGEMVETQGTAMP